ncbi:hypothetical protein JAAARDRAFT_73408 [Jaapia argillacea MUCL 33604]|uniref:Uncharacterized protein n=1 Tax=Jaapia argillacea MUCL 33604 TaxID=933084 RepID=A0A067PAD0_9AGAM|nr:hypothetical protein JAAARDRAFT_73408 [Jaapia argillacea MUCL 33604]
MDCTALTSHDREQMALAWPRLRELYLTSPSIEFDLSGPSHMDSFRLNRFDFRGSIGFNFFLCQTTDAGSSVKVLNVDDVWWEEGDVRTLAQYIVDAFPYLDEFHSLNLETLGTLARGGSTKTEECLLNWAVIGG